MFNNRQPSPIEQFRELTVLNSNACRRNANALPENSCVPPKAERRRRSSLTRWLRWKRETVEGAVHVESYAGKSSNEYQKRSGQEDLKTQAEHYSSNVLKLVNKETSQRRAHRQFSNCHCYDGIETLDAFETSALHYRKKVEAVEIIMKDDPEKDNVLAEIRLVFRHILTELRTNACGLRGNSDNLRTEENL